MVKSFDGLLLSLLTFVWIASLYLAFVILPTLGWTPFGIFVLILVIGGWLLSVFLSIVVAVALS